eukprot:1098312-Alexandrium_andersonii.AAC.1
MALRAGAGACSQAVRLCCSARASSGGPGGGGGSDVAGGSGEASGPADWPSRRGSGPAPAGVSKARRLDQGEPA